MSAERPSRHEAVPGVLGALQAPGAGPLRPVLPAAFRRHHQPSLPEVPLPPKGAKRAVTVYECDGCGEGPWASSTALIAGRS